MDYGCEQYRIRRRSIVVLLSAWLVITFSVMCGPIQPPQPPPPPPVSQAELNLTVNGVTDPTAIHVQLIPDSFPAVQATTSGDGRFTIQVPTGDTGGADYQVTASGYVTFRGRLANDQCQAMPIPIGGATELCAVTLTSEHFDPSSIPLEQLANIRGGMWTARWDGPLGPRPGDPSNILAMDFLQCFGHDDQMKMIAGYKARGYTHAVTGPIVDSDGYHGQYCVNDWRTHFDDYLDVLQLMWDNGLMPVIFIHPDNWTYEQTIELTTLFQSDRAQRLMRIVVPTGWEPTRYGWSSCTWDLFAKWARTTWPNALVLIHTVTDADAPVGTDERCNDDDHAWNPTGNAGGWARVTPDIHGWLPELGACEQADPLGQPLQNFVDLFDPTVRGSYADRFRNGYAGWPTSSAWGPGIPIRLYYGESCAYPTYWGNLPETVSWQYGDGAMKAGANGYLDGGQLPVPLAPTNGTTHALGVYTSRVH